MLLSPHHTTTRENEFSLLSGYSLEMTIKDMAALEGVAARIRPGASVAIAHLPGEKLDARIAIVRQVRDLGFEPKVHLPARRLGSHAELACLIEALAQTAGLRQVLVIAGDADTPAGPFENALSVIETGLLEANGIELVSVGGHPEGHQAMDSEACHSWLVRKVTAIRERGMAADIVTQFGFNADAKLGWLSGLRAGGIDAPVRLGVPGPASARRLLAFAARCGVAASTGVLRKYGLSLTSLMSTTGPDRMVDALEAGFDPATHGQISLHLYPFGGLDKTVDWIAASRG